MSYFSRAWVAASVAVVNSHSDQGIKLKSGFKGIHLNKKRFSAASGEGADLRPLAGVLGSDVEGAYVSRNGEERRRQSDESLRQVMYLSCWGPS